MSRGALLACGAVVCGAFACVQTPPRSPDLLLVTFDTTRADAIGVYGAEPSPTPTLDALAAEGLRIREAMSVAPLTLPAHTSILSGIYPDVHGVRDNGVVLPEALPLVAESLREAGYGTGAVVAAVVLDGSTGIDRGFEVFHDGFDISRLDGVHEEGATRDAAAVVAAGREVLAELDPSKPRFLWLHFYDPHQPLTPPAAFAAAHPDPYAAEVAYADAQLGDFLQTFPDRSGPHAILVVADHGEGRGEHGEASHGQFVYRSTLRVPLIVSGSGVVPGVRDGPASVVDVAPTLLALAGRPHAGMDGRSLLDDPVSDRLVYGESYHQRHALGLSELHVLQGASERYIEAPRPELYDWKKDPGELADLPDPSRREVWVEALADWRADRPRPMAPGSAVDPDTRRALAALGYVSGEDVDPDAVLPDPKDHADLQARVDAVVLLARTSPPDKAVPLLRSFVRDHPGVRVVRTLLVRALQFSGDGEAAWAELEPLLASAPEDVGLHAQAAELALLRGRPDLARSHLDAADGIAPQVPALAALRGELARRQGRCAQVLARLDGAVASTPEATRVRLVRGACRLDLGDVAGARVDLERVQAEDPANGDVRYLLALAYLGEDRPTDAVVILEEQLGLTPDVLSVREALGQALLRTGRTAEAIPHLEPVAADPASGVHPVLALAEARLATEGPTDRIAELLDEAARRAPKDPRVDRIRANYLLEAGRSDEALEAMLRSRQLQEAALRTPPP